MSATVNGQSVATAVSFEVGRAARPVAGRLGLLPDQVSPLYQSITEQAVAAGFAEAAWALALPFAGVAVGFAGGRCVAHLLAVSRPSEREALMTRRRAEASIAAETEHLHERWADEFRPRVRALVRRIEALELERYAAIALPTMIDKIVDAACELAGIQFKIAIPALTALERFDTFVAHNLKGFEPEIGTMLVGPVTERMRAESGLADLAGAAKVIGLRTLIEATPAGEAMGALAAAPLGEYYLVAVQDYLRAFGHRQDEADLTAPAWRERPELAIARIRALLASGDDARAAYEAALIAAVKATNVARGALAEQPGAIREQFEALLLQARVASALLDEQEFLLAQRTRVALRAAFLKLGGRLAKLGLLGRADDLFMLTLEEIKEAVTTVPSEATIGATRVRVLEREAQLGLPASDPSAAAGDAIATGSGVCALDRALARIFGKVAA